ncbi:DNA helicase II [Coxiella endosymbiont of Amblyomma nuttalli]|uniref:DNA helicase II n=1 Tax=Coxiella endosymbiont of Amblyomma nuttalli TaxID=2749996 RepID=UPI001BAC96D3|nr:DNA helicase II [Coxiella endosymbiont of Amblyomma nuttalli]QTS84221.1 DNA helicase II [Coxiella endosymbiont of Amblyomma nuttalli]
MVQLGFLKSLNQPQKEAVTSLFRHIRILAGAGSGKTRVLTCRIAWIIQQKRVLPHNILAATFTNKAAYEMRRRIEATLGISIATMWVGTFHQLAHRLLRTHWKEADLPQAFRILDTSDQYRLVRRIQQSLNLEESQWPPKQTQWFINKQKEEGLRSNQEIDADGKYLTEALIKVYQVYEGLCHSNGLVDFSELMLRSFELLRNTPAIRKYYQQKFQHILVDEFQDTNTIQYIWLQLLVGNNANVMVVGDDDQSIYSWRGAKVENIHRFSIDFKDVKTIRLEQNYRSTQTILDAANAIIKNNSIRLRKKLWTRGHIGKQITLYTAFNERDEMFYIMSCIEKWIYQGRRYSEIGVLYRSNVQSRLFEEGLIDRQIPYRIYGGPKFFERAEIKDALCYLRLLADRHDDAAFERIVNTPTRGIGNATLTSLHTIARDENISFWQATLYLVDNQALHPRALHALQHFLHLIETLHKKTKNLPLSKQTEIVLTQSGLLALYKKDRSEKGLAQIENLEELVSATSQFTPDENIDLPPLNAFLSHVTLESDEAQAKNSHNNCVNLMTLHAAKGLEFPLLIISGLEEDLFPHRMSIETEDGIEEERRLCYVGITRAREELILTHAAYRHLHGLEKVNKPSRFLSEIPAELINTVRPAPTTPNVTQVYQTTSSSRFFEDTKLYVGQRVNHKKFGLGVITNYEGQSEYARLQVKFDKYGAKWLMPHYAKLKILI